MMVPEPQVKTAVAVMRRHAVAGKAAWIGVVTDRNPRSSYGWWWARTACRISCLANNYGESVDAFLWLLREQTTIRCAHACVEPGSGSSASRGGIKASFHKLGSQDIARQDRCQEKEKGERHRSQSERRGDGQIRKEQSCCSDGEGGQEQIASWWAAEKRRVRMTNTMADAEMTDSTNQPVRNCSGEACRMNNSAPNVR